MVKGLEGKEQLRVEYMGKLKYFGDAVLCETASANLISHGKCEERFKREWNDDERCFKYTLKSDDNVVFKFFQNDRNLFPRRLDFVTDPDACVNDTDLQAIDFECALFALDTTNLPELKTIDGAPELTIEEIKRAKEAFALHRQLGHVNFHSLALALNNGSFVNMHLTSRDCANFIRLFGNKCTGCLLGKMPREVMAAESQSQPAAEVGQVIHADVFFIDGPGKRKQPVLATVDDRSGNGVTIKLKNKKLNTLLKAMEMVVRVYRAYGHVVKEFHSDNEAVFGATRDHLGGLGITLNQTSPEHHERRVERYIRTLRDGMRATKAQLKFKLPRQLYYYLLLDVVSNRNMIPNRQSGNRSPREIVTGKKVDASKVFRGAFGEFIIAKIPNQSTSDSDNNRAEHGVIIGKDLMSPGTIKMYGLQSKQIVKRMKFATVQATSDLVRVMNKLAAKDTPLSESQELDNMLSLIHI